jgi:glutaminase
LGLFSPPLDARGNSVRGVEVCRRISTDLNLHFLSAARPSGSIVRASYSLARVGSKRVRSEADSVALDTLGERARVYELQGTSHSRPSKRSHAASSRTAPTSTWR